MSASNTMQCAGKQSKLKLFVCINYVFNFVYYYVYNFDALSWLYNKKELWKEEMHSILKKKWG